MKTLLLLILLYFIIQYCNGTQNPYKVLGIQRDASLKKIKKAYKDLALKWHPDKNDDPKAQEEMMKVNEAYQILSDPKKKAEYDSFGTVRQENERYSEEASHNHFFHQFRGPNGRYSFMFDDFPFGSFFHSHDYQKKNILNEYNYKNIVLPDSHHKVFLILVLHDMCFDCLKIQRMWEKMSENLESIGIGTYELFYNRYPQLVHDIGAQTYPQFIAVIAGRPIKYKNTMTERYIRDFLASIMPHFLVTPIIENERDFFEQSLMDNKPQVLLFSRHMYTPLLFLVVAYEYQSKVKFAYVYTKDLRTKKLASKYNINTVEPTIVVLKEEPSVPIKIVQGTALKRGVLRSLVSNNLYLHVPRLSSQQILDDLCPKSHLTDRTLCLVLLTKKGPSYSTKLWKLREMVKDGSWKKRKVQFLYVFTDIQKEFMDIFNEDSNTYDVPCSDGTLPSKILIFWRRPDDKIHFDWYVNGWCKDSKQTDLKKFVMNHVTNEDEMKYEATNIPELQDEHWHGHFWDFISKSYEVVHSIVDAFDHPSWTNTSTIGFFTFVFCMLFIGFVMPLVSDSSDGGGGSLPRHTPQEVNTTVLGLQKLDYKSQKRFLHEGKPGQITVAVLVDTSNLDDVVSSPIIQAFSDSIYIFSRNASYTFTWLSLSENLIWCTEITNTNTFGEFVPGCVIAMNGFRKYAYIYKPTYIGERQTGISADFIGFESSDEDDQYSGSGSGADTFKRMEQYKAKKAAVQLRRELPQWLERLFEGLLKDKIRVEKWPQMEKL